MNIIGNLIRNNFFVYRQEFLINLLNQETSIELRFPKKEFDNNNACKLHPIFYPRPLSSEIEITGNEKQVGSYQLDKYILDSNSRYSLLDCRSLVKPHPSRIHMKTLDFQKFYVDSWTEYQNVTYVLIIIYLKFFNFLNFLRGMHF